MAIARGAGTEIIRSIHLENVNDTARQLIYGAQHHVYTVLSIIVQCQGLNAATDNIGVRLIGYDSVDGTTAQDIFLFNNLVLAVGETFVFNDKFSFNGHEPTDFTGPVDSVAKQDAIADQGSSVAQVLYAGATHASDNYDIWVTFIDQNNE